MMRLRSVMIWILLLSPSRAFAAEEPGQDRLFGINHRLPWNNSRLVGTPEPPPPYRAVRAFPRLTVQQPLGLYPEPGTNRLFLLQHLGSWSGPGRVLALPDDQNVTANAAVPLLDVDGLAVGLAFHPDYERNGFVYIGMNGPLRGPNKKDQVVRYTVSRTEPRRIDPASRTLIIDWASDGHDGGDLVFGNDGFLYITSGDGSSDSDAHLTGQTLDDLLGAVLRIDVDHPDPGRSYSVPRDNPFVNRPRARPELWAYGLRNPWRISVDRPSGQLWVGNNGQDLWEQVYLIQKGANYGWSLTEGSHVFQSQRTAGPDPISPPAAEHPHSEARSISGGRVYRGTRLPELVGAYVYGDWSTGRVWAVRHDGKKPTWNSAITDTPFHITGFGTDHADELYVIDQVSGFHRLERRSPADHSGPPFPRTLSETGLFASVPAHAPHPAAIPYEVVCPQWADGATMERFAAFPGLDRIKQESQMNAGGAWTLPNGTALVQTLTLNVEAEGDRSTPRRVETRVLIRQEGEWAGYSYRWNAQQTEATLVPAEGASAEFEVADAAEHGGRREQVWRFPARTECMACHSRATGFVQGFTPLQLDRDRTYSGVIDNQLRTLEHIGMFEGPLPPRPDDRLRLVDAHDSRAALESRVRSYLHVNCATCHVEAGGGNARMELGATTPRDAMRLINQVPAHDHFGLPDARLVAAGSPERSVLLQRLSRRGTGQMPPLVSTEVDRAAVTLFTDWIRSLPASPPRHP